MPFASKLDIRAVCEACLLSGVELRDKEVLVRAGGGGSWEEEMLSDHWNNKVVHDSFDF